MLIAVAVILILMFLACYSYINCLSNTIDGMLKVMGSMESRITRLENKQNNPE